jgi:hypothetical protein
LLALERTKKAVLVGDYWQLPPVYLGRKARAEFSAFNYFYNLLKREGKEPIWLQNHYRCNPKIIGFSSKYVYDNKIIIMEECKNEKLKLKVFREPWLDPEKPVVFLDVEGHEERDDKNSKYNIEEAKFTACVVDVLKNHEVKTKDIWVLTPFRAQVEKIRGELKNGGNNLKLKTVHTCVGGERDVVVFSAAATDPQSLSFIDKRMTNLFVTRAKKKLIVIGSSRAIKDSKCFLLKLYEYAQNEAMQSSAITPSKTTTIVICNDCGASCVIKFPEKPRAILCPWCREKLRSGDFGVKVTISPLAHAGSRWIYEECFICGAKFRNNMWYEIDCPHASLKLQPSPP